MELIHHTEVCVAAELVFLQNNFRIEKRLHLVFYETKYTGQEIKFIT